MTQYKTPDEVLEEARLMCGLPGPPWSRYECGSVLRAVVCIAVDDMVESVCLLMRTLYGMPLTDEEVETLVQFQLELNRVAPLN